MDPISLPSVTNPAVRVSGGWPITVVAAVLAGHILALVAGSVVLAVRAGSADASGRDMGWAMSGVGVLLAVGLVWCLRAARRGHAAAYTAAFLWCALCIPVAWEGAALLTPGGAWLVLTTSVAGAVAAWWGGARLRRGGPAGG